MANMTNQWGSSVCLFVRLWKLTLYVIGRRIARYLSHVRARRFMVDVMNVAHNSQSVVQNLIVFIQREKLYFWWKNAKSQKWSDFHSVKSCWKVEMFHLKLLRWNRPWAWLATMYTIFPKKVYTLFSDRYSKCIGFRTVTNDCSILKYGAEYQPLRMDHCN